MALGRQGNKIASISGLITSKCLSCVRISNTPTLQKKVEISSVTERPLPGVEPKPGPLGPDSLLFNLQ